jgi:hypothetical protein
MKKYAGIITAFALITNLTSIYAQNSTTSMPPAVAQSVSRPQYPRAHRSGVTSGVNGAAIAAGVGIIVAIAAIAIISNNSHSH